MKTIHFWKAYGISNQKNNVAIYFESHMAAIYFYKMAALKQVLPISQPSNTIVYEIYTFLENVWCKQSEKRNVAIILPRVLYGRYLAFHNMAAMKQVFVNISVFK